MKLSDKNRNVFDSHLFLELNLFFFLLVIFHNLEALLLDKTALLDVELLLGFGVDLLGLFVGFLFDESHHVFDLWKNFIYHCGILTCPDTLHILEPTENHFQLIFYLFLNICVTQSHLVRCSSNNVENETSTSRLMSWTQETTPTACE